MSQRKRITYVQNPHPGCFVVRPGESRRPREHHRTDVRRIELYCTAPRDLAYIAFHRLRAASSLPPHPPFQVDFNRVTYLLRGREFRFSGRRELDESMKVGRRAPPPGGKQNGSLEMPQLGLKVNSPKVPRERYPPHRYGVDPWKFIYVVVRGI